MIHFSCPSCGAKYKASDESAGRQTNCRECGRSIDVPTQQVLPPVPVQAVVPLPVEDGIPEVLPALDLQKGPPSKPVRSDGQINRVNTTPPLVSPPPVDYPVAFVWWQRRKRGQTFPFSCPDCATTCQLRLRVTQTKRVGPGCGFPMTVSAIDRQLDEMEPERRSIIEKSGGCAALVAALTIIVAFTTTLVSAII